MADSMYRPSDKAAETKTAADKQAADAAKADAKADAAEVKADKAEAKADAKDDKADAKAAKVDKVERAENGMKLEEKLDDSGESKLLVSGVKVEAPAEVKHEDRVEGRPVPGPGTDLYLTSGGYQVVPSGTKPEDLFNTNKNPAGATAREQDSKDK